jgi:MFS family permease
MTVKKKSQRMTWRTLPIQRRVSTLDHLRPQRWAWSILIRPVDHTIEKISSADPLPSERMRGMRFFWLDGLFAAISENFYLGYIPLFALAFGATNKEVGLVAAAANLMGAAALFPGATLVEKTGRRKTVVVWTGGILARLALIGLGIIPFFIFSPAAAVGVVVIFNGIRAFAANLANPAWTSLVADLVPDTIRGRYFGSRNMAMGVAALAVTPLAGWIIVAGNDYFESLFSGYQIVFFLAFLFGMISTAVFQRIPEPETTQPVQQEHHRGDLREAIRHSPGFVGLVISAFVWNLSLQVAAPFFNVYLVTEFGASTTTVGLVVSVSSLTALFGQVIFGKLLDSKGALWMQLVCGFIIPILPWAWVFVTAPWQVGLINTLGGFIWAGFNLANFNLLLELTPDTQRPRAVALFQTAVFTSAVLGPFLGGLLADLYGFKLLFILSGSGRLIGMIIFAWLVVGQVKSRRSG